MSRARSKIGRLHDAVGVIEAAYRVDVDQRSWLQGLLEGLRRTLGEDLPAAAFTVDFSDPLHPKFTSFVGKGLSDAVLKNALMLEGADERGLREWQRNFSAGVTTLSRYSRDTPGFDLLGPHVRDAFGILSADHGFPSVVVCVGLKEVTKLSRQDLATWFRVRSHMAAGLRLRQTYGNAAESPSPDAVIDPGGRLLHAEHAAKEPHAREALCRAAVAIDRARGRLRYDDTFQAVQIWQGLVSGRWSLVELFERDNRRYMVARRNAPVPPPHLALTLRERQIIAYAALGHSNKLIAYELGVTASTVAASLANASKKLRVKGRLELIKVMSFGDRSDGGAQPNQGVG